MSCQPGLSRPRRAGGGKPKLEADFGFFRGRRVTVAPGFLPAGFNPGLSGVDVLQVGGGGGWRAAEER